MARRSVEGAPPRVGQQLLRPFTRDMISGRRLLESFIKP
jgi:hypothetical protein